MSPILDPLAEIRADRTEARKIQDANADTCFLALASKQGEASVRTLVLRDIVGRAFRLFMNNTSPKWQLLTSGATYELLLWYPSQQKQYRIRGETNLVDTEEVKSNWLRRPQGSKYLDYVYKEFAPQSSEISSRAVLTDEITRLKKTYKPDGMTAPDSAMGVELIANHIEMLDLNREDRIHDRRVYSFEASGWQERFIIP
ncbi:MAG: pyridoxamine 5'-phosphate oxidase family protein [Pseudomonadales bacterium]